MGGLKPPTFRCQSLLFDLSGHFFQIKRQKEEFNREVRLMKQRKAVLLEELEETSRKLIDVQFRLDAGKRKPVRTSLLLFCLLNPCILGLLRLKQHG